MQGNALPTFQQAGRFAALIGINTEAGWQKYVAGKTREDIFQQVLSTINHRVIEASLED